MYENLKKSVCKANLDLHKQRLVVCSWGNVSGFDPQAGVVAIKPSGVAYEQLQPQQMVVLSLDGKIIEGCLRPSSDTPTHLELYRNFKGIQGICHTHSPHATMWAQACREISCLGTTHADFCHGPVPLTELLGEQQIQNDYERNTGKLIVKRFEKLDPLAISAVLVAGHGPFTWGTTPDQAVEKAMILEQVAAMALGTLLINPQQAEISRVLLDKHYLRKHGTDSYYGQKRTETQGNQQ